MRPAALNSGASWFLSTGSFSVLGTLPLSWEALEESLVERLMLALSSFGVCGFLLDCHWQEWLWPFKSLCKQTKAPMQIDKQNQRLHQSETVKSSFKVRLTNQLCPSLPSYFPWCSKRTLFFLHVCVVWWMWGTCVCRYMCTGVCMSVESRGWYCWFSWSCWFWGPEVGPLPECGTCVFGYSLLPPLEPWGDSQPSSHQLFHRCWGAQILSLQLVG